MAELLAAAEPWHENYLYIVQSTKGAVNWYPHDPRWRGQGVVVVQGRPGQRPHCVRRRGEQRHVLEPFHRRRPGSAAQHRHCGASPFPLVVSSGLQNFDWALWSRGRSITFWCYGCQFVQRFDAGCTPAECWRRGWAAYAVLRGRWTWWTWWQCHELLPWLHQLYWRETDQDSFIQIQVILFCKSIVLKGPLVLALTIWFFSKSFIFIVNFFLLLSKYCTLNKWLGTETYCYFIWTFTWANTQ